jgi:hypothetical protein
MHEAAGRSSRAVCEVSVVVPATQPELDTRVATVLLRVLTAVARVGHERITTFVGRLAGVGARGAGTRLGHIRRLDGLLTPSTSLSLTSGHSPSTADAQPRTTRIPRPPEPGSSTTRQNSSNRLAATSPQSSLILDNRGRCRGSAGRRRPLCWTNSATKRRLDWRGGGRGNPLLVRQPVLADGSTLRGIWPRCLGSLNSVESSIVVTPRTRC